MLRLTSPVDLALWYQPIGWSEWKVSYNVEYISGGSGILNKAMQRMPLEILDLCRLGEYSLQIAWRRQDTRGVFVQKKSCQNNAYSFSAG